MAETEEWILKLVDQASGSAATAAAGLNTLDKAQLRARDSSGHFIAAQKASGAAAATAAGGVVVGGKAASSAAADMAAKVPAALSAITGAMSTAGGIMKAAVTGDIRGTLDQVGGLVSAGVGKVQALLGAMGPYGQAAAAVLGVVTGALQATIGSMLDWAGTAIKMAQAKAGISAAWSALAGGEAAGKTAASAVGKLGDALPFAGSQVRAWAQSMLAAGVSASQLEGRVKAVASAEALMRENGGGGAAAEKLFKRLGESAASADKAIKEMQGGKGKTVQMLADMGLSVGDVAKQLGMTEAAFNKAKVGGDQMADAVQKALTAKGAGSLEAMMGSWPVILDKARAGFSSLFSGLGPAVEPMMAAVRSLFSEFNKGSVLMTALKPIVTAVFGKLFEWATMAANAAHKAFLYVMIGALTAYIAMRPLLNAFAEFVQSTNFLMGVKAVLVLMAIPILAMVAAFVVAWTIVGAVAAVFGVLIGAVVAAAGAVLGFVGAVVGAFTGAYSAATAAGGNFVDGLVAGISAGAGVVVDAVKALASGALGAFTGAFGIKSPSTVMLKHGQDNIAGAAATGIDRGADKVDESMSKLGGAPKGGGGARGEKGGGPTINFYDCTFGEGSEERMRDVIDMVWREMAAEAPEPA